MAEEFTEFLRYKAMKAVRSKAKAKPKDRTLDDEHDEDLNSEAMCVQRERVESNALCSPTTLTSTSARDNLLS